MSNRVGGPRGDAIIKVKNESGRALSGQLTYTPSPAGAYEVRAGANRSAAEAAEVVRTDDEGKTYGPASHTEAYIRIVPAAAVIPDVPDTDASSGTVGAVIVGTAIGGAAAFVGYEIATDIILHDLLPAGADIPVNRGQLAWLIWGAKGAPEPENQPAFTVDLLLDASASRLHCQEVIAAQGVILAESLTACGIPVRVSCFSSLRGYTVLRVFKGFSDKNLQNIHQYFASGWNRDGLALRAAGDLLDFAPGPAPRHLLILLTDASPNDSRRVPPSSENPLGHDYGGAFGVDDAAAEVRTLRRKGLRVSAVFMGEDRSIPDAERIYGKDLARIRGMDQLARAAGQLIQNEIRELGD